MKKNTQTFTVQEHKKVLNALNSVKNIQTLSSNDSIDILVDTLMDCPSKLKGDFISALRSRVGDSKFSLIQAAMQYKKFETSINGLVKGKKLDFEDKGSEFILKDSKNVILQGMSKDSEDTINKAFDYLKTRIHKQDPLRLMTLMNKLVASEFGQNVLTKNPELLIKYQEIRDQIVQAIADALHARAANIFNKITKEELQNPKGYLDSKQCPNLIAMDAYISGLTLITAQAILGNGHELDVRTLQLHDLIAVGEKLVLSGSFNAFMGIFVSLTTTHIHRLKNTWEGLSISDKDLFKKFEMLMEPFGNKKALRNEQNCQKEIGTRVQSQLAIVKSDIIYARDGNLNLDGSLKVEAFQKAIQSIISSCLDSQPSEILEQYKDYDRPEFHLTMQECNKKSEQLLKISTILEPKKKDETPVGSKIVSNLTSSGNVFTTLVKSIYTQIPHNARSRSSSVSEKPKSQKSAEQQKMSYFKELLFLITQKEPRVPVGEQIIGIKNKRKSEYQFTKERPLTLFHQRAKSFQSTPDNWLPPTSKIETTVALEDSILDDYKKY